MLINGFHPVFADEGMWLLSLIGQQKYDDMKKKGLTLSSDEIYNINRSSLKDAIVQFGGGCTGELVSDEGLLITNHHCGYGYINALSTEKNNYLKNGYWAMSRDQELPAKGCTVLFMVRMEDVTQQVTAALGGISDAAELKKKTQEIYKTITDEATKGSHYEAFVRDFFRGNQYFLFVMERYTDVRLVGTPPENIGKFGGETDNWMWPRHTGDFSVFRVYAGPDNKPAPYSTANKPLKPKHSLPISLKGYKPGDYAMILGFPGRTNRYLTATGIQLLSEETNPLAVKIRFRRMELMKEEMDKSDENRLKMASQYASLANYWKKYDGEAIQLRKNKVFESRRATEEKMSRFIQGKPDYATLLSDYENVYQEFKPFNKHFTYMNEATTPLMRLAMEVYNLELELDKKDRKPEDAEKMVNILVTRLKALSSSIHWPSEQNVFAAMAQMYFEIVPSEQWAPELVKLADGKSGKNLETFLQTYASKSFAKSALLDTAKFRALLMKMNVKKWKSDPVIGYAMALIKNYRVNYFPKVEKYLEGIQRYGKLYIKAWMEMEPNTAFYPDANFTLRFTYGTVEGYQPADATQFHYLTTLKGVAEKFDPQNEEFQVPQALLDLYKNKDFGKYGMPNGELPVAFITNNDITGGNSGSPVLNGRGELIGTAFDGNWEAMSGDVAFDPKLKRTISVDIRYVLFIIDKLSGAGHLVKEMKIVE